jgi:hypothetical protein
MRALRRPLALCAVLATGLPACGGDEDGGWTVDRAESITSVRGLDVRVRHCRGVGEGSRDGSAVRYQRLRCVAGARLKGERFDTVAVLYDIRPSGSSDYELENVSFTGGPGIP